VALVTAALPFAKVLRNADRPTSIPPGGLVIIRDGDPGDPEVTLSPPTYIYDHRIGLEVAAYEAASQTREQVLDQLLGQIGDAVRADRFLGGLCDFLDVEAASTDDIEAPGALSGRWADTGIVASYGTADPLN
jgi:hypothetical protein